MASIGKGGVIAAGALVLAAAAIGYRLYDRDDASAATEMPADPLAALERDAQANPDDSGAWQRLGFAYFDALSAAALKAGVKLIDHAPVSRLVVNAAGEVLGVEIRAMPPQTGARARHEALLARWKPLNPLLTSRRRRIQEKLEALEAREGTARRIRAREV